MIETMPSSGTAPDLRECRAILQAADFEVIDLGAYFAQIEAAGGPAIPHIRNQIARLLFFVRGDDHIALRRATLAFFRPATLAKWQPTLEVCAQTVAESLSDAAATGSPVDLVEMFSARVSGQSICRILGLPIERSAKFDAWAEETRWLTEPMLSLRRLRQIESALSAFSVAIREAMVAGPPAEADGKPTFLHHANPALMPDDRIWLTAVLYAAGQSTLHSLANILLRVSRMPPAARTPLLDVSKRMLMVDRLLAADGSIQFISRLDSAGRRIDLPLAAAGLEALEGKCPFDPEAPPAPPHLAFGAGSHKCLGNLVARLIIAESLTALISRFPEFRLARAPSEYQKSTVISSPCDLFCILQ